ncbi:DUF1289 domain-containing protein [Vibrio sp. SCSIO 43135]|uniref:DUF1289 domain-containing protein n=1 Tax=Vibrio sp. SCSIO 43135 TaxID=2819096 RepID=UPI0020760C4E|nr:DUF1289 domain-containing protein [Vibrio sp. SCSIO 43135]USD43525.1 DUF1289 domain-containing protein [Vibrio sp. SCSIO 43135]
MKSGQTRKDRDLESVECPCIRHCCLDDKDVCVGCFRTLEQILNWNSLSELQKRQVLAECQQRKSLR